MRQPLLYPTFALMAGIVLAEQFDWPVQAWFWAAAVCLGVGWLQLVPSRAAICASAVTFGGFLYGLTQAPLAPDDLRGLAGSHPQTVMVRGTLLESPSVQLVQRNGAFAEYMTVRLAVREWLPEGGAWQAASGTILISSRGVPGPTIFRDQRVQVGGILQAPSEPAAPGLFDYREFLRQQGIGFQLMCEAPRDWALDTDPLETPPYSDRFISWAQRQLQAGLPNDQATGLIQAMTLGWKTGLAGDVQAVFMQSGTLHVFAISGLHIALIAATLVQILRFARVPRAVCGLISIPLIWGYIAATGWQASAIRSAAMTTMVVGTWAMNRPGDLVNSLAASAIAVLLWQPGQLFQAGFQLSFGVVLSLAWFGSPLAHWLKNILVLRHDPLLAPELVPRWHNWVNAVLGWLAVALATGLAANIGSLPLTIQWFHMLSPVSLGANLLIVPLSEWVLLSNLLTFTVGWFWPWLAELANASAWGGMNLMVWLSRTSAELPHGWWYLRSPHWVWWIPYMVLLTSLAERVWRRVTWRSWLVGVVAVWVVALLWVWIPARRSNHLVAFAGTPAMYWQAEGGSELLIDGATESQTRRVLEPYLHSLGRSRVDDWLITQADTAHIGKGGQVLRDLHPARIVMPPGKVRSPEFKKLAQLMIDYPARLDVTARGERVNGWAVLYPLADDDSARARDHAVVLRCSEESHSVLCCSELSELGQEELARIDRNSLRADVLVISVSSATRELPVEFLNAVRPRCVLLNGAGRAAHAKGLARLHAQLRRRGIAVWLLEKTGTVTLDWSAEGLRLSAMDGRELLWGP